MKRLAILIVAMASSAQANDFAVTADDQKYVLAICDIAAQTPAPIPRDARANIAGYCFAWQRRMDAANAPPQQAPQKKE